MSVDLQPQTRQEHYELIRNGVKWCAAIPHRPHPKQLAAILAGIGKKEVFFGGAAGPGKSDWLLMEASQYLDVPSYAAIIFRKTFTDLSKAGALISRAREWFWDLKEAGIARWDDRAHAWHFQCQALGGPPGLSSLSFGHIDNEMALYGYQSAEYNFIGWDEVNQFPEDYFTYMNHRLRRRKCQLHKEEPNPQCHLCIEYRHQRHIPLRIRAASNPPSQWIRDRYKIVERELPKPRVIRTETQKITVDKIFIGTNKEKPFVPAFVWDNPALDVDEYVEQLSEMDPVTRDQMLKGDWSISAVGRFKKSWFHSPHEPRRNQRYSRVGSHIVLGPDGKGEAIPLGRVRGMYQIVDPAASAREGPGDEDVYARSGGSLSRAPSWTVIGTFLVLPPNHLILWDWLRFQREVPDVIAAIKLAYYRHWYTREEQELWNPISKRMETVPDRSFVDFQHASLGPSFVGIENSGLGIGVYQSVSKLGITTRAMQPKSNDKLVRSTDAQNMAESGRIWLPQTAPWVADLEAELFSWTGHPNQQDDQIDVLAYAATESQSFGQAEVLSGALPTVG